MGKAGKIKGGKGTVQLPYDLKLNSGPIKKRRPALLHWEATMPAMAAGAVRSVGT